MRSALLALALACMTTMTASIAPAAAQTSEGSLQLWPVVSTVPQGRPFTVYLVVEDLAHYGRIAYDDDRDGTPDREVPSDGLAAFDITIEYDPGLLAPPTVGQGPALSGGPRRFQCLPPTHEPGKVRYGCLSSGDRPPGPQGTMTLAEVVFQPLRRGTGPLVLTGELAGPLGSNALVEVRGAAVRVEGGSDAPAPGPTTVSGGPETQGTPPGEPDGNGQTGGQTPASGTAQPGENGTPGQPGNEDNGGAGGVSTGVRGSAASDGEAGDARGGSATQGGDNDGTPIWPIAAGGAVVATVAAGLGAVLWRRRNTLGGV